MTDPVPDLAVPDLDPDRVERMRRRGRRVLAAPAAGPMIRVEASLVRLFSFATLLWAASAVVRFG